MELYYSNEQDQFEITESIKQVINGAVGKVFEIESIDPQVEVSILFVDNEGIRILNRNFRNKDTATDVLSFPQYNDLSEIEKDPEPNLGDIVLSLERTQEQAAEYGHSFERELGFLTVHSMYHLLGYDHDTDAHTKAMREKEEAVLQALGLKR